MIASNLYHRQIIPKCDIPSILQIQQVLADIKSGLSKKDVGSTKWIGKDFDLWASS